MGLRFCKVWKVIWWMMVYHAMVPRMRPLPGVFFFDLETTVSGRRKDVIIEIAATRLRTSILLKPFLNH